MSSGRDYAALSGRAANTRSALVGCALVVLSAIAFSGKAILAKLLYRDGVDALTVIALRMGFSLPLLFALLSLRQERRGPRLAGRDEVAVLGLGAVGYYASVYGDFAGLEYVSAGLERLLMFTYPTLVLLLSALLFKQPIRSLQIVCLLITYAGIAIAFRAEIGASDDKVWLGSALVFASAFCYAAYLVAGARYIDRLGAQRFTALSLSAACVTALAHFGLAGRTLRGLAPRVYGLALVMAVFATVLPALALSIGIRRIGAARAAVLGTVGPVSTLFLAYALLGEPLTATQLVGAALVALGATLVAFKGR